jgi:hypothetical protein
MADQFLRTCNLPPKPRLGVGRLFAPIVRIEAPKKCFEVVAVESFSHPFDDRRHGYRPPFCRRAGRLLMRVSRMPSTSTRRTL